MNNELQWKDVVGYEGIYEVSNNGLIRKKDTEKIVNQAVSITDNYYRVDLWKDGIHENHLVHNLVAQAHLPKVKGKTVAIHFDGNRQNNHVDNLEWVRKTKANTIK